jgi:hypothetical protein
MPRQPWWSPRHSVVVHMLVHFALHQQMARKSIFEKNIGSVSVYNNLSPDE